MQKNKIYGITGSKSYSDYKYYKSIIDWFDISKIVSEQDEGIGKLNARYSADKKINIDIIKPDWIKHKGSAIYKKTEEFVLKSDEIILIYSSLNKELEYLIEFSGKHNVDINFFQVEEDPLDNI
jgi:hypothetical protein